MALNAPRLDDSRDLVRIRHVALFRPAVHAANAATDRFDQGCADRLSRQNVVKGIGQMVPRRGAPHVADPELVIDFAPIADRAAGIQNERFGGAGRAEFVGDLVGRILQNGKRDSVDACEVRDGGQRILLVGIDGHELHALFLVMLGQNRQFRAVLLCEWTVGSDEDHGHRPAIFPVAQRVARAKRVLEGKSVDALPDRRRAVGSRSQKDAQHEPRGSGCRH